MNSIRDLPLGIKGENSLNEEAGLTATVTGAPEFVTVTGHDHPARHRSDQQSSAEQEQTARLDRERDQSSPRPNVTAAVTTGGDLAPAIDNEPTSNPGESGFVRLRGVDVRLDSEPARTFITDCARNIEGLRSDREIKEAWGLDVVDWARLAEHTALLNEIKAERERRIRNGEAAREAAQRHFAKAPSILNEILQNEAISPRHRIEAAKELRQVAGTARESAATTEKFVITIDLGQDYRLVKEFDQPARIPGDDGGAQ